MTEQSPMPPDEARVALMVEILHTYRARNLARTRGETVTAQRVQHHLSVLLDQLAAARATQPGEAPPPEEPRTSRP